MAEQSLRVLIIEDNAAYAELLKEMLAGGTVSVFTAESAHTLSDGLARACREKFDAALLDLHLPDAEGTAVYESLRSACPVLPIVIVSASTEEEGCATECLQKGAQDYLVKGDFDRRNLMRSIRHAVQRKKMEVEYRDTQAALVDVNRALVEKVHELDRLNMIMMGREERILEMKEEIRMLSERLRNTMRPAA